MRLGIVGVDDAKEFMIERSALDSNFARVARRLAAAGFDEAPSLILQHWGAD